MVFVRLTAQGDRVFSDLYPRFNAWSTELFGGLSAEQTSQLADLLQGVVIAPQGTTEPDR